MKVGSKVVCINAKKDDASREFFVSWVEEGQTYTVRRCEGSLHQGQRILLDEISNPPIYVKELFGSMEPGFAAKRFVSYEDYVLSNAVSEEVENDQLCEA